MDLEPTADQLALVEELRRLLKARVPTPALVSERLWDELADLGLLTLPVPEADGGVGLGWAEVGLAFQEVGRSGLAGPLVTTAAATGHGLAKGVTGVVPDAAPALVEHHDRLDSLLALGPTGVRRVALPLLDARAVERPLDPLTPVHRFDQLPTGEVVGDSQAARRLGRSVALLAAATQVGLGQAALAMATTYAGQRQQFGRPIGSFQAIKHLLADAAVGIEVARAAVDAAAVTTDEAGGAAAERAVASARVVASEGAARAARACIQVHGGMGYTWELTAHLYLKRILVLDQLPATVEDAIALLSGDDAVGP